MCVQRFDDSLNSAIHITYRISLRSSSMPEPRDPLLKVLIHLCLLRVSINNKSCFGHRRAFSLLYVIQQRARRPAAPRQQWYKFTKGFWVRLGRVPAMIPPLVHQRRPCYDFYFL